MTLTERDNNLLIWIEKYKAITINQAKSIFFNGIYESARRRLFILEKEGYINSYYRNYNNEKVYYNDRRLSDHDLFVFDFIKYLKEKGCRLRKIKTQPRYLNDGLRPDAFIEFQYDNEVYFVLLEIDYTHYTSNMKMQMYEMLYKREELKKDCYGTFPIVIIARPNLNCIKYNSKNFDIIYTDYQFSNLDRLLFQ